MRKPYGLPLATGHFGFGTAVSCCGNTALFCMFEVHGSKIKVLSQYNTDSKQTFNCINTT